MRLTAHRHGPLAPILLCLLFAGCARDDPAERLHGRWDLIGEPYSLRIQFAPDGLYRAQTSTGTFEGRWALTAPDQLATWSEATGRPPRQSRFSLEDDTLIIHQESGKQLRHRRAP